MRGRWPVGVGPAQGRCRVGDLPAQFAAHVGGGKHVSVPEPASEIRDIGTHERDRLIEKMMTRVQGVGSKRGFQRPDSAPRAGRQFSARSRDALDGDVHRRMKARGIDRHGDLASP